MQEMCVFFLFVTMNRTGKLYMGTLVTYFTQDEC